MATKTQKEFKKNMKKFEKEGKIPNSYYSQKKYMTTGKGAAIASTIVILFFMSGYIRSFYYSIRNIIVGEQNSGYSNVVDYVNNEINSYNEKTSITTNAIYESYLDIYRNFFENKPVEESVFIKHKENLLLQYENVITDVEYLKDISDNYKENLDISVEMVEFAISHYNNTLTLTEKQYLEALIKKSTDIENKRYLMFEKAWSEN